jgi:hypothetical protein
MPHVSKRPISDEAKKEIRLAYKGGVSMRPLAERFNLPLTTVFSVIHEAGDANAQQNIEEIREIDKEIAKLRADQRRAKRKNRNTEVLAIGRELRNWFVLRTKATAVAGARAQDTEAISPAEALQLAKSIIETNLTDQDVIAWVRSLLDREVELVSNLDTGIISDHSEVLEAE